LRLTIHKNKVDIYLVYMKLLTCEESNREGLPYSSSRTRWQDSTRVASTPVPWRFYLNTVKVTVALLVPFQFDSLFLKTGTLQLLK